MSKKLGTPTRHSTLVTNPGGQVVVASSGYYLFLSSSLEFVRTIASVRAGTQAGLGDETKFKALTEHAPKEGNQFFYVSPALSRTLQQIQTQAFGQQMEA